MVVCRSMEVHIYAGSHERENWRKEGSRSGKGKKTGFLHWASQPEGCSLERSPCSLERTLSKLERTSLWLRPLERTLGRLERSMFWMSSLERTCHHSSKPDAT